MRIYVSVLRSARILSLSASLLPMTAVALEAELPDRFGLKLGAFIVDSAETDVRLAKRFGSVNVGTLLDFSRDLDVDDSRTVMRVDGYYRFTPRHRIDFSWYDIRRRGSTVLNFDIDFGDVRFSAGTEVSSFFDAEITTLAYGFSFHHTEKVELGILAGVHVDEIAAGIDAPGLNISETADATLPLPVLGLHLDYGISRRWRFKSVAQVFFIERDEFKGSLTDLQMLVEHRTFKRVGFGGGWNRFVLDLETNNDELRGQVRSIFNGFQVYTTVHF